MSDDEDNKAPKKGYFRPRSLAPFFVLTAIFHALCVATRFDEVAAMLPAGMSSGLLIATFPLLFIEGYFESRLDYGDQMDSLPLWMRIKSKPVKAAFTFAFTYLAVVVLQTWDISIGGIDPTPPPEFDLPTRARWFAMMTGGMFFINFMAAASFFIPALRAIGKVFHKLPSYAAIGILGVLGSGAGFGIGALLHNATATDAVTSANSAWSTFTENPTIAIAIIFAGVLLPMIYGAIKGSDDD